MIVKDRQITETEILEIIAEREKWEFISFEEMYVKGKNYIPNLW